jgi:hypothetical protein
MPKWIKFILALLLLPACAALGRTVGRVLLSAGAVDAICLPLLAGMACWFVIFLLLPQPMWLYVFGHEFTHALWTWLFGGQVKQMKVSSGGGHVVVSKNNFLIVLAPYFFPFYAALVVAVFGLGGLFWNWHPYLVWFHLALGAAYAFHITLTWQVLHTRQSDITSQGWLFSGVVIFLGNAGLLLVAVPLIAGQPALGRALGWFGSDFLHLLAWLRHGL